MAFLSVTLADSLPGPDIRWSAVQKPVGDMQVGATLMEVSC